MDVAGLQKAASQASDFEQQARSFREELEQAHATALATAQEAESRHADLQADHVSLRTDRDRLDQEYQSLCGQVAACKATQPGWPTLSQERSPACAA